jgi:hypothetical protein
MSDNQLEKYKSQFEDYLTDTIDARRVSEKCRDYYDGNQWTAEEINVLAKRKQAPIVVNRVKPKVEGLKGLLSIRKTDIKAFPRNIGQDEESSHAITDALRYVYDSNDFDTIKADCFENKIIEGVCAISVETIIKRNEPEIKINAIMWDRFYFDPLARKKNFSDARYMGEMIWLDKDQLVELFPNKEEEINSLPEIDDSGDETTADKPLWKTGVGNRQRFRICKHYSIENGKWMVSVFCGDTFLLEPTESPYLDEEGKPDCPIIADTAYIDRNNARYGEVKSFLSQQDEINHRRSKALHLLSARQIITTKAAIDDKKILEVKNELAKPDGIVQVNSDVKDFVINPTSDFAQGQVLLYQDAKAELDATSFNAQLSGERQKGDLSGKAIDRLQSAGTLEIDSLYKGTSNWEKRVFRAVYDRIRQFWTAEKWVRVTDNQDNLRWIGFNTQITLQKLLEEKINDKSQPLAIRVGASATYQALMQTQDPRLQTIVEVRNKPAELDVDLILEESFDVVNIQQEQFELLVQFAQSSKDIDIVELIELSQLRNKKELIEKIEARRAQQAQTVGNIQQMQAQEVQIKNAKLYADTQVSTQKASQMAIENHLLMTNPQKVNSVAV